MKPVNKILRWVSMWFVLGTVGIAPGLTRAKDFKRKLTPRKYACLIGVNAYTNFRDLTYSNDDVRQLQKTLKRVGFNRDDVVAIHDGATTTSHLPFRNNVLAQMRLLFAGARSDDLVFVSFSGHGVHIDGQSYLCPSDADLDDPTSTMIPLKTVYRMLDASRARQKVLVVDACRNDPRPAGTRSISTDFSFTRSLEASRPPGGVVLLNSCAENQYSVEDPDFQSGVFMHFVNEGLSGKADADKNRKVTFFELYRYTEYKTKAHVRSTRNLLQTPVMEGRFEGIYELASIPKTLANVHGGTAHRVRPDARHDSSGSKSRQAAPILRQADSYFREGSFDKAITAYTAAIYVSDSVQMRKQAYRKRGAAYLAKGVDQNFDKALTDYLAAGSKAIPLVVTSPTAHLKVDKKVTAKLKSGQVLSITRRQGDWLWVTAVAGNDAVNGWIQKSDVVRNSSSSNSNRTAVNSSSGQQRFYASGPNWTRGTYRSGSGGFDYSSLDVRAQARKVDRTYTQLDRAEWRGAGPARIRDLERQLNMQERALDRKANRARGRFR